MKILTAEKLLDMHFGNKITKIMFSRKDLFTATYKDGECVSGVNPALFPKSVTVTDSNGEAVVGADITFLRLKERLLSREGDTMISPGHLMAMTISSDELTTNPANLSITTDQAGFTITRISETPEYGMDFISLTTDVLQVLTAMITTLVVTDGDGVDYLYINHDYLNVHVVKDNAPSDSDAKSIYHMLPLSKPLCVGNVIVAGKVYHPKSIPVGKEVTSVCSVCGGVTFINHFGETKCSNPLHYVIKEKIAREKPDYEVKQLLELLSELNIFGLGELLPTPGKLLGSLSKDSLTEALRELATSLSPEDKVELEETITAVKAIMDKYPDLDTTKLKGRKFKRRTTGFGCSVLNSFIELSGGTLSEDGIEITPETIPTIVEWCHGK